MEFPEPAAEARSERQAPIELDWVGDNNEDIPLTDNETGAK